MKDNLFNSNHIGSFEFNDDVACVFDDMLARSIPFYDDTLKLNATILNDFTNDGGVIYDFGSSTLNFLLHFEQNFNRHDNLIGIDNSISMINQAKSKIKAYNSDIDVICGDIENIDMLICDGVIMNYTMQFISPTRRQTLIDKIYNSLKPNGIFIFSEKLKSPSSKIESSFIDIYHKHKQNNGYSLTQIAKKKEALENVLIPFSTNEYIDMCKKSGFIDVDISFKWLNFSTFVAIKGNV